mgnify:CR=1 FL=1
MTRKILAAMLLVLVVSSMSYAAESEDMSVYLRRDVFDAKMDAFMAEIRLMNQQLRNEINDKFAEVDKKFAEVDNKLVKLDARMDGLDARMNGLEKQMSSIETMIYWILGTLGVVFAGLALGPYLKDFRKPSFTLDDVKRLLEEHDTKLRAEFMNMAR